MILRKYPSKEQTREGGQAALKRHAGKKTLRKRGTKQKGPRLKTDTGKKALIVLGKVGKMIEFSIIRRVK